MDSNTVTAIVTGVLFVISEILPLLPIHTSGILHTLILGTSNAFKSNEKDVELAIQTIQREPGSDFVNIINALRTSPKLKKIITNMIADPSKVTTNVVSPIDPEPLALLESNATLFNAINPQLVENLSFISKSSRVSSAIKKMEAIAPGHLETILQAIEEVYHNTV